ncbi:AgmX/PglI C-terminal domain-containing protein [Hyalangium rubrum]|uniref:AgmX/PglI C-terminal domain-containing protein n=1 Tax=Hyalangium rubrum TaxID=3103134 RepID=A0ABU5GZB3_9BACT|nr:AgmX/PglI C-terminal domain-containing protein [Hyalangium sp. s54d21]MDY7226538.1 AgmX/PglI C-terminal domain-containing protein [Hyalangium sp. s54d21]
MSAQPSVLQVVILRDGLLVGTEVFVPGTYAIGSDSSSDLRLDDASIDPRHAVLYFQNGRSAIQDAGSTHGVYVNGHRVSACEIRPVDEVLCGPFVLKTRVLSQRPADKPQPPPEVAALLGAAPPAPHAPAPQAAVRPLRPAPAQQVAATVPVARSPVPQQAAAQPPAPELLATTVPIAAPPPSMARPPQQAAAVHMAPASPAPTVVPVPQRAPVAASRGGPAVAQVPTPVPVALPPQPAAEPMPAGTMPSARRRAPQELQPVGPPPSMVLADDLLADMVDPADLGLAPVPAAPLPHKAHAPARPTSEPSRPTHAPRMAPGKGAAQLYLELYWGGIRREAHRFQPSKQPLKAAGDTRAPMPLWGFSLPEEGFTLAESLNGAYRLFVPPGSTVERSGADGRFQPVQSSALEADGNRRFVTLRDGAAARLSQGTMSLVAYAAPVPEKVWVNPLKGLPWLALGCFFLFSCGLGVLVALKPDRPESPDFTQKNLPPIALRLLAPEPKKKEEAKKKLEAIKEKAKPKKEEKVAEKPTPKPVEKTPPPKKEVAVAPPPPESRALKALAKLSAAGPATNDLLAAVDKLGSGPGSKNVKTSNYKLSGLIGKAPIANAGLGTFGLGGGGKGGGATLGAELLRGKGGGGIGALGAGGVGKGKVGGVVTRATTRSISATQGSIDREAVAKVINSHLQEVHACYERGLLKDPGLAGKVVLEWTIGAGGRVAAAKTKSSTLRNASVEACILSSLKGWAFPTPKGGVVIISYPFIFNSVGY